MSLPNTRISMGKYSLVGFLFPIAIIIGVCWLFKADIMLAVLGAAILNSLVLREWFKESVGRPATWPERNAFILQNGVMSLIAAVLAWIGIVSPVPYPVAGLVILIVLSSLIPLFAAISLTRPIKRKDPTLTRSRGSRRKGLSYKSSARKRTTNNIISSRGDSQWQGNARSL